MISRLLVLATLAIASILFQGIGTTASINKRFLGNLIPAKKTCSHVPKELLTMCMQRLDRQYWKGSTDPSLLRKERDFLLDKNNWQSNTVSHTQRDVISISLHIITGKLLASFSNTSDSDVII